MEELRKNMASSTESAGNRMELNKETIIDFEKRNTKVLIADDDDNIRKLIDEILKTEHVPTTVCSSGLEALDLIKREDFGIIISDIKIRDFDGMGLLKPASRTLPSFTATAPICRHQSGLFSASRNATPMISLSASP